VRDLSEYKCAIFDCDGVILQSNEIKTNAFREALESEPKELVDQFISYHKSNGGVSRYVKFEHYYRDIKLEELHQSMAERAIDRYAQIVVDQLMVVDYVPGVISVINYFNSLNIPCFVVSGGDQSELHDVFMRRSIHDKFVDILGSPVTKKQHITAMVKSGQMDYPAIFFGDARSDMDAALNNGIDFCYVSQFSEWSDGQSVANDLACMVIHNYEELLQSIS